MILNGCEWILEAGWENFQIFNVGLTLLGSFAAGVRIGSVKGEIFALGDFRVAKAGDARLFSLARGESSAEKPYSVMVTLRILIPSF